jgi:hypothetical protein
VPGFTTSMADEASGSFQSPVPQRAQASILTVRPL